MYSEIISGLGVIASIIVAYHTAKYSFNTEIKKNKSLLISACIRFYTATIGCVENGKIRKDKIKSERRIVHQNYDHFQKWKMTLKLNEKLS